MHKKFILLSLIIITLSMLAIFHPPKQHRHIPDQNSNQTLPATSKKTDLGTAEENALNFHAANLIATGQQTTKPQ